MYLKKLEIHGFKSFASKTALEFPDAKKDDKGITAIVGPNGSGKSNTADAIRWILGEQSMKTLRGKSTADLIFSGSDKKTRLGFAEASLHLDNTSRIADIEYEEIVITRRIYRNGESEYLLNKKPVRLADILMMLAKAKFAQKTYSVIGQGMIDSILTASASEKKEFFDEAAGVKEYQIKRDQSLNKLKSTQINLQQVDIMLNEIEPRLKSLTRQVKRLEKREEIEKELQDAQIKYYSKLASEIQEKIKIEMEKEHEISPRIKELQEKLVNIQKKLNDVATQTARSEAFTNLQSELNKLLGQKNNLLREQAVLKGKLDIEYTKSGQINMVWLDKRKEGVQNRINELNVQLQQQNPVQDDSMIKEKQDKLQKVEMEIDRLKGKIDELKHGGNKLNDEEIKDSLRDIVEEQRKLVEKFNNANTLEEFKELKNSIQEIYQKISTLREKFILSKDTQHIVDELKQVQDTLETFQNEKRNLLEEIHEATVALKVGQNKKTLLEQELTREKEEMKKIKQELEKNVVQEDTGNQEEEIRKQNEKIEEEIKKLDVEINKSQDKINDFNKEEEYKKNVLIDLQRQYGIKQNDLNIQNNRLNEINIELTKLTTRHEGLMEEVREELQDINLLIKNFSEEINRDYLYNQIQQLKHQLELIGGIDEEVVREYTQIKERYEFLDAQTKDLKEAIISLEEIIEKLDNTIKKEFNVSFEKINGEFEKYFKILFNGGKARLVKITQEEVNQEKTEKELALQEIEKMNQEKTESKEENKEYDIRKKFRKTNIYSGVEVQAAPPGKKVSNINMLSGGERALTSISLICAIISCNPSPFVVLDEVDAALDEANSERFAAILNDLSHKTQFIAITHNRATMRQAKVLYGVTMASDGVSKLLSIRLEDGLKQAK
ncbi:MAG: chromosome segregation SMC family protein [bacterium]